MSNIRELEKHKWASYFNLFSKNIPGEKVDIEIISKELGEQKECRHLSLIGIVYEPSTNTLHIACEKMDHFINTPKNIYVEEVAGTLHSLITYEPDGTKQVIEFTKPLLLPA